MAAVLSDLTYFALVAYIHKQRFKPRTMQVVLLRCRQAICIARGSIPLSITAQFRKA
jgi:hypothetical protein